MTIWEGFQRHFAEHGLDVDVVLYTSYERQVAAQLAGHVHVAWHSPLAWLQTERAAAARGRRAEAIAMRDTDRDLTSVIVVRADGPVTRSEGDMLRGIHARFGLDRAAWERAKGGTPRGVTAQQVEDPYRILGLTRDATDEEIRAAWRQLMRENHPDSLASRGVPEEFVKRATAKVADINAAWDRIKRERGL